MEWEEEMSEIRGTAVLILSVVLLTTFLASVKGLPLRKPRNHTPKERDYKLVEVSESRLLCSLKRSVTIKLFVKFVSGLEGP